MRIPQLNFTQGEANDTLFRIIEKNVRAPTLYFGDLRGQLSACHTAETQFLEVVDKHGREITLKLMRDLTDYAERLRALKFRRYPMGK